MECDMISSPYSVLSQRLDPESESSSDLFYDEFSCTSPRNHRKRFWKGNEYETINDSKLYQNYSPPKIHRRNDEKNKLFGANTRKKIDDIRHSVPCMVEQNTIKLVNVPVKMNNILDLFHSFSRFGTINMIQAQRHSNPFCALLSFQTTESAINAMENAKKVISNVKAAWFTDFCSLNSSGEYDCNLERFIDELIHKKNTLLSNQMDSLKEIMGKIDKCPHGSEEETMLLRLLKKVQDQIYESTKSIEYSVKQKKQYFTAKKKQIQSKPVEKLLPKCPPWITASKNASAKSTKNANYEMKRRKNYKPFTCLRSSTYQKNSVIDNRSSSASERAFADDSSEDSTYERCFFSRLKDHKPKQTSLDTKKSEHYEYELDCLLSDMQESE